jgi:hypothetical protein
MQILGWARDQGGGAAMFARLSFRILLIVAIPAWFAMRIGAEWIRSKEFPSDADEPSWIGIGYVTAEPGGLLLLISVVLAGIGARRLAKGRGADWLTRSATVLVLVVLAAYLVALWAMTAKPG